jgi:hypothetical protein
MVVRDGTVMTGVIKKKKKSAGRVEKHQTSENVFPLSIHLADPRVDPSKTHQRAR